MFRVRVHGGGVDGSAEITAIRAVAMALCILAARARRREEREVVSSSTSAPFRNFASGLQVPRSQQIQSRGNPNGGKGGQ